MTFKQFSIFYLEMLKRLPGRERALALAILIVLAGTSGLPGSDDLDDLIDTAGQMFGYATNSAQWREEFAARWLGKDAGGFMTNGVSEFLPLDVSSRLGLGNLIPGSSLLKRSEKDRSRDFLDFAGAAGGFGRSMLEAYDYVVSEQYAMGAMSVAPKAFKDLAKAVDMARMGAYRDTHGRRVADTTPLEALIKAVGFHPSKVAELQRAKGMVQQNANLAREVSNGIAEMWAQGVYENNAAMVAKARGILSDWNRRNPGLPVALQPANVQRRVRQMRLSAAERTMKSVPKSIRRTQQELLQEP